MGYTTDFEGRFDLDRIMDSEHAAYLKAFAETRRMKRDPAKAEALADPIRLAVGLPIGAEGGYFVGGAGFKGQDRDPSVIDGNWEPEGQPGLWCQWTPTDDHEGIEWDGVEKFSAYTEWLEYLIGHFLGPWGYQLNGKVEWQGEATTDLGTIHVRNNVVRAMAARVVRPEPKW